MSSTVDRPDETEGITYKRLEPRPVKLTESFIRALRQRGAPEDVIELARRRVAREKAAESAT
jgi:hypothetical protein